MQHKAQLSGEPRCEIAYLDTPADSSSPAGALTPAHPKGVPATAHVVKRPVSPAGPAQVAT